MGPYYCTSWRCSSVGFWRGHSRQSDCKSVWFCNFACSKSTSCQVGCMATATSSCRYCSQIAAIPSSCRHWRKSWNHDPCHDDSCQSSCCCSSESAPPHLPVFPTPIAAVIIILISRHILWERDCCGPLRLIWARSSGRGSDSSQASCWTIGCSHLVERLISSFFRRWRSGGPDWLSRGKLGIAHLASIYASSTFCPVPNGSCHWHLGACT